MCMVVSHVCMYMYHMCAVLEEARRGYWLLWNRSYRQL